ncbi:hypothetical protein Taro_041241 [Colocasia esculenta]|uniref:O-fucosyltransferase family protein n=1 Tax=Colocasia esculenta TaxID=4460 RepID=A0A843WKZ6_COLES|nr:hypothetical protein [Colocasia esculenta]
MMKPVLPQYRLTAAVGKGARTRPLRSCLCNVGGILLLWLVKLLLTAVVARHLLPTACSTGCDVGAIDDYVREDVVDGAAKSRPALRPQKLDKESYWADPSDFEDIFDLEHFVDSLRDQVQIVRALPTDKRGNLSVLTMTPVHWSNETYYTEEILRLFEKHEMVHFNRTDCRLANNGHSIELQKLRCRVNYEALKFTPKIQALGDKLVSILRETGPFVVLHLRYEMDMLSFSGCARGCTDEETEALTRMRYSRPLWREKEIDSEKRRLEGLCPLTPEEVTLVLQALGFGRETPIYIAAGETYGGERRLAALNAAYPKLVEFLVRVKKEMLLSEEDLRPFQNHLTQMAALDYHVSLESDVFIPTYGGNMAKVVEGHRRYMGFRKTILFDRKQLVQLLDLHQNGTLSWDQFAYAVRDVHKHRIGEPARRKVIEDRPKEEDYFHANPYECLSPVSSQPGYLRRH